MKLFTPLRIREIELKNRIVVSPICQYSAKDGHPQTWHLVHLGSRAVGGAGLVMAKATAVEARGGISPSDTGIYEDLHIESWRPIVQFILQVVQAVRKVWPQRLPLFVRLSATDWNEGGWDLEQAIELSRKLKSFEVDLIDVSSGGAVPAVKIPLGPGYQVKFSESSRKQAGIATGAVGLITEAAQAETILVGEQAVLIFLAREMLRDPYWPRRAAKILGEKSKPPVQYERAW